MAVFYPDQWLGARLVLVFDALIIVLVTPDMRAKYGTEGVKLTFGVKGIWRERIPREDIAHISIVEFGPMKDFGGWGPKLVQGKFVNTVMWALPTKKPRGILLETTKGKKYIIGDENPDATLALLASVYPMAM